MLQTMRDNLKGTVAFFIVGFISIIMALSLVDLTGGGTRQNYGEIATVEGQTITERELQIALARERQRLQAQFGDSLPGDFLSDERLRAPVLTGLVQRAILIDKANASSMTVSNAELDQIITQMPDFQLDGQFNPELFVQGTRRLGHTPATFRDLLRDDVVSNSLRGALSSTAFITQAEVEQTVSLSRQTRDFSWITLPLGDLTEQMEVTDTEIESHYDKNKLEYNTEEQVSVEYIELKVSDIVPTISIGPEDIQQQYDTEVNAFTASIEREAAHIMIEADSENADQKISEVQEKLAAGEDFAELAKSYSDDFGSRDNGGNLGVTTGDAFPEAFESVLISLNEGEVSDAVEIDGATHFIKLVSQKEETPPSFEESRDRIENELKQVQAETLFVEQLNQLKDLSYNADNLVDVASEMGLDVDQTELFTAAGGIDGVLRDSRVVNAAFSDQVLHQGYTSDVLELAPDHAVVINLTKHEPVRTLTLDEKREDILAELKLAKATAELANRAESITEQLNTGADIKTIAEEQELVVNTQTSASRGVGGVPSELSDHVFNLARPSEGKPVTSSLSLNSSDYAIISLTQVNDAEYDKLSEEERQGTRLSLARTQSAVEFRAWQRLLENGADIDLGDNETINLN